MGSSKHSGPQTFSEMLKPVPESIGELATQLRGIFKGTLPDADECFYGGAKMGMVLYSIDGPNNVVGGIQPTDTLCKVFFHGWKQLAECGHRLEGSGKNARHLKIRSVQELDPEKLAQMLRIARSAIGK